MSDIKNIVVNHSNQQVPVGFWYHFSAASGVDLDAFKDPEIIDRTVSGTQKLVDSLAPDFVKLMSDGLFHYQFNYQKNSEHRTIYDALAPITDDHPWLKQTATLIAKQRAVIGKRKGFYNIFSPTTLLKWALVKQENGQHDKANADKTLATEILKNPDAIKQALQVITQDVIKQVQTAIRAGADGIYYSTQVIQDQRLNQGDFEKFVADTDHQVLQAANKLSDLNVLHICGNGGARNNVHWFQTYEAAIINWATDIESVSLREGKRIFPNKTVLGGFGNTKYDLLYQGTKADIQQYVHTLIQETGRDHLIIGANCTVPRDIDLNRLRWVSEAVQQKKVKA